jgi:hypothetical protein
MASEIGNADRPKLFASNPTEDRSRWYVWDMYAPPPPKPIFFGTMEECGLVA